MRGLTPRSQTTTLPATLTGSSDPKTHRRASSSVAAAFLTTTESTSGEAARPVVVETPTLRTPLPNKTVDSLIE